MKKRHKCMFALVFAMISLAACGEAQTSEAVEPQTYGINTTSTGSGAETGYEISDMMPAPDEIFVISVEDAEELMRNRAKSDVESAAAGDSTEKSDGADDSKALVVYFTRAENIVFDADVDAVTSASINLDGAGNPIGNLRLLAEYISEETGAEIFSIRTVDMYPTGYRDTTDLATEEKNENARPALSTHLENMDDYDVIYLGYPNWWGTLPMPVASFLEEYDFAGKTIIPFASHEGSGLGSGVSMIKELCPEAEVSDGFAVRGGEVNTDKAKEAVAEFTAGL